MTSPSPANAEPDAINTQLVLNANGASIGGDNTPSEALGVTGQGTELDLFAVHTNAGLRDRVFIHATPGQTQEGHTRA